MKIGDETANAGSIETAVTYPEQAGLSNWRDICTSEYFTEEVRKPSPITCRRGIPERVDRIMRRVAWEAIVESPYAGIDDENRDGLAD